MFRSFARGGEKLETNVEIPEGGYDPRLGLNYSQIAREGLGYQKSQNGGIGIPAARQYRSGYHRFASSVPAKDKEKSFFDGIDVSLEGIASLATGGDGGFLRDGLRKINASVEKGIADYSAHPEEVAAALAAGLNQTVDLLDQVRASGFSDDEKYNIIHELEVKRAQFNDALAEALGVSMRATVEPDREVNPLFAMFMGEPDTFRMAIPNQGFKVKVQVTGQASEAVSLTGIRLHNADGKPWNIQSAEAVSKDLKDSDSADATFRVKVPPEAAFTRPYFSRPTIEQPYYTIDNPEYLNLPLAPYPLEAWAEFSYRGAQFRVGQVVQTVKRVTGYGPVLEPLTVGPAVSVSISPRAGIVPLHTRSFVVTALLHSDVKGPATGNVRLELPEGWKSEPTAAEFSTSRDGEDQSIAFQVTPSNLQTQEYQITAVAEYGGRQYKEGYHATGYPGLRPYYLYEPSTYRTAGVDVKVAPDLKAAYIMGSGDDVPASLQHLGIKVSTLGAGDLAAGDLSKYDIIVLGVRAYAAREELATYNSRLLDYVKNGGVVIVQYNTPEFDHNYGPYPYIMSDDPEEVTDEASEIQLLEPSNPVFNWPNKITSRDFEGWVEERGSKFMKSWDPRYTALLSTHDADQAPQKGGLLYARYGKGIWIYNAYAFYRELPEGVPGAYRIFANLVSLPKNPDARR